MLMIDAILSKPNKANELLEKLKNASEPVVVFTTGAAGRNTYRILSKHGVKIACFADNSKEKIGYRFKIGGITAEVIGFENIIDHYPDAYIVVPPRKYLRDIFGQFTATGYDNEKLIGTEFEVLEYKISNKSCEKVYSLLADERSRAVFCSWLNYVQTGDISYLTQDNDNNTIYFDDDIISLSDRETVVDGGGYTGDTFLDFIGKVKTFERYYLCEPDPDSMRTAKNRLSLYAGVTYVSKGLWSGRDVLIFSALGSTASSLNEYGTIQVDVISIDELLAGKAATFIKMNIEGAEIEALRGAIKTIHKYKPKLSISADHSVGDFINIPMLIHELNPEYKLYLRHYLSGKTGMKCYAI